MKWDYFICHASEDKREVARPLALKLSALGLKVWYDEFSLSPGDSLRRSIDKGLLKSQFGIVILSHNFFKKKWTLKELDGLNSIEMKRGKTIIPIWHQISADEIIDYSPMISDKFAMNSSEGMDSIADRLSQLLVTSSETNNNFIKKKRCANCGSEKFHAFGFNDFLENLPTFANPANIIKLFGVAG